MLGYLFLVKLCGCLFSLQFPNKFMNICTCWLIFMLFQFLFNFILSFLFKNRRVFSKLVILQLTSDFLSKFNETWQCFVEFCVFLFPLCFPLQVEIEFEDFYAFSLFSNSCLISF